MKLVKQLKGFKYLQKIFKLPQLSSEHVETLYEI